MRSLNSWLFSPEGEISILGIAIAGIMIIIFLFEIGRTILPHSKNFTYKERIFKVSSFFSFLGGLAIIYCSMLDIIQSIIVLAVGGVLLGTGITLLGYGVKYEKQKLVEITRSRCNVSYKEVIIVGWINVILMCIFLFISLFDMHEK